MFFFAIFSSNGTLRGKIFREKDLNKLYFQVITFILHVFVSGIANVNRKSNTVTELKHEKYK